VSELKFETELKKIPNFLCVCDSAVISSEIPGSSEELQLQLRLRFSISSVSRIFTSFSR